MGHTCHCWYAPCAEVTVWYMEGCFRPFFSLGKRLEDMSSIDIRYEGMGFGRRSNEGSLRHSIPQLHSLAYSRVHELKLVWSGFLLTASHGFITWVHHMGSPHCITWADIYGNQSHIIVCEFSAAHHKAVFPSLYQNAPPGCNTMQTYRLCMYIFEPPGLVRRPHSLASFQAVFKGG